MTPLGEAELRAFLSERRNAVVATVNRDGSPHQAPVWFHFDGRFFYFVSERGTRKVRNLRRDPRVSLCVEDPAPPERAVIVRGQAEFVSSGWLDLYREMASKYVSGSREVEEEVEWAQSVDAVFVRIIPEQLRTWTY